MFLWWSVWSVRFLSSWAMRSVAHGLRASLAFFLAVYMAGIYAADLNCLEGGGRQICLDRPRVNADVVIVSSDNNDPHPATVKGAIAIKSGPVVAPVRPEEFLPQYFVVRRSQLGQ